LLRGVYPRAARGADPGARSDGTRINYSNFRHTPLALRFLSSQEDAIGIRLRDVIGVDNLMCGSDYRHSESTFPHSRKILADILVPRRYADLFTEIPEHHFRVDASSSEIRARRRADADVRLVIHSGPHE
jgi:hypothetical protein